jgi:hypothetical protein
VDDGVCVLGCDIDQCLVVLVVANVVEKVQICGMSVKAFAWLRRRLTAHAVNNHEEVRVHIGD